MSLRKIGLLVGREWSWPPRFLEEIHNRDTDIHAEYVQLGGTNLEDPNHFAVLIDRISHEVPYYRFYLKHAVLQGVCVLNNPFMVTADDRFLRLDLAGRLGVARPRSIVLPNKDYGPGIIHGESLRNLVFPLDWGRLLDHVGLPCTLRKATGNASPSILCHSLEEVWSHYDQSGLATMMLQEHIPAPQTFRCLALGQREVLPIPYDPVEGVYLTGQECSSALEKKLKADALTVARSLGYEICSVEFAVRDQVPVLMDCSPFPDMDLYSLGPVPFDWAVKQMADLAIERALHPRPAPKEMRWKDLL